MTDRYILDGKVAIKCEDLTTWAKGLEGNNRDVGKDAVKDTRISTVFLGLDHSFGDGPPLLFETMVFGGALDGEMDRYTTWEDAKQGHKEMIKKVEAVDLN